MVPYSQSVMLRSVGDLVYAFRNPAPQGFEASYVFAVQHRRIAEHILRVEQVTRPYRKNQNTFWNIFIGLKAMGRIYKVQDEIFEARRWGEELGLSPIPHPLWSPCPSPSPIPSPK